jgi:hypothetical protein
LIPTLVNCASYFAEDSILQAALDIADWELRIQLPNGAIPGGTVAQSHGPVVFNTGQVILGWCSAYSISAQCKYLEAAMRAADFIVDMQDLDGAWRRSAHLRKTGAACL